MQSLSQNEPDLKVDSKTLNIIGDLDQQRNVQNSFLKSMSLNKESTEGAIARVNREFE